MVQTRRFAVPRPLGTPLWAAAIALASAAPAAAEPLRAVYSVRGGGLQLMTVEALFDLDQPARYSIQAQWRTTGMARLFGGAQFSGGTEGRFAGTDARPTRYAVEGTWRGDRRQTVLEYPNGVPVLRIRLPVENDERQPVPEAQQRGTIDQFSAMAQLSRMVSTTGRCDGQASVYEGLRLVQMQVRTGGRDRIFPWSTSWSGEATRCSFVGRQVAGFKPDDDDRVREPQESTAWMASPRPGAPVIPVRVELPSRLFGSLTIYLMEVGNQPANAVSSNAGNAAGASATGAPPAAARAP